MRTVVPGKNRPMTIRQAVCQSVLARWVCVGVLKNHL